MDILPLLVVADNAAAAAAERTARPRDDEFFTGEFTDAKFEAFLDAYPGRRRGFMAESAAEQGRYRARIARLWALRTSTMPADLLAAVTLADQLFDRLKQITEKYTKAEGRRVLEAAGLTVPNPRGLDCSWSGDHFANAYRFGRQLARSVDDYSDVVWSCLFLMLPNGTEEPLTAELADPAAADRGAA